MITIIFWVIIAQMFKFDLIYGFCVLFFLKCKKFNVWDCHIESNGFMLVPKRNGETVHSCINKGKGWYKFLKLVTNR